MTKYIQVNQTVNGIQSLMDARCNEPHYRAEIRIGTPVSISTPTACTSQTTNKRIAPVLPLVHITEQLQTKDSSSPFFTDNR